jgi:type IV pilus assembly protein PilW
MKTPALTFSSRRSLPLRQRGFSLVELLVGMAIALVAMLAVTVALSTSEQQRRKITGGSEEQAGSTIGTYLLERDLRMAGYGIVNNSTSGILAICGFGVVSVFNSARLPATATSFQFNGTNPTTNAAYLPFTPIAINPTGIPAGDTGTDVILINYSGSNGMVADRAVVTSDDGFGLKVSDRSGFHVGDLILAAAPPPATTCAMTEITSLPGSGECDSTAGDSGLIVQAAGNYGSYWRWLESTPRPANCPSVASNHVSDAITGLATGTYVAGRVFNLGDRNRLVSHVYAVRNGNLTMCDLLTHNCADATMLANDAYWRRIAPNVIRLSAQFNNGGTWTAAPPISMADWMDVTAVRFALVSWGDVFEKNTISYTATSVPDSSGNIAWSGGTISVTGIANWDHYRYKLIETRVALRNLIGGKNIPEGPTS